MPLYEYECQQCHRHTEKRQKFSDPEITQCPHCGGPLKRVLSAPAISFKGGGWYADGYGNAKPKQAGEGSSGGESKAAPASSDNGGGSKVSEPSSSGTTAAPSTPSPAPAAPASTPSPSKS